MGKQLNIVGWSPYRGAGGVTAHLLAMSLTAALFYGLKVYIRADHFGTRPLEGYISALRREMPISDEHDFYSDPAYPNYLKWKMVYTHKVDRWANKNERGYILSDNLCLLSPVDDANENVFPAYEGDICFIDSSGCNSLYSFTNLENSDIIIVFLPDNTTEIRNFFSQYRIILHKCFFVVNRFSGDRAFLFNLAKKHRVLSKRLAEIPYCGDFANACMCGALDSFIDEGLADRADSTYLRLIRELTRNVIDEAENMKRSNRM